MAEKPDHSPRRDSGTPTSPPEPWATAERSLSSPVPDISKIHHNALKIMAKNSIAMREASGAGYEEFFRELQIAPNMYQTFFEQVILVVRNKNIDLLKRSTDASILQLTRKVLSGYGYICWIMNSGWTMVSEDLAEGETRLLYDRQDQKDGNQEFYPIFEKLWRCMRNLIFEPKALSNSHSIRRTPAIDNLQQVAGSDPPVYSFREKLSHLSTESSSTIATRDQPTTESSNISQSSLIPIESTIRSAIVTQAKMDPDEITMANIQKSLMDFSNIYYQSDPARFRFVWQQHIGPIELLDVMVAVGDNQAAAAGPRKGKKKAQASSMSEGIDTSTIIQEAMKAPVQTSEPEIATAGYTLPGMYLEKSITPTTPPSFISLYISKSRILDYGDIVPVIIARPAFFQSAAPIAITNMTASLDGVDLRADIPRDHAAFAYVFSYPWNDAMIVIHNDQPGYLVTDAQGVDQPCQEKRKKGWACLQKDITAAAQGGNRVWRLKVLVLYGTLIDEEEGATSMVV